MAKFSLSGPQFPHPENGPNDLGNSPQSMFSVHVEQLRLGKVKGSEALCQRIKEKGVTATEVQMAGTGPKYETESQTPDPSFFQWSSAWPGPPAASRKYSFEGSCPPLEHRDTSPRPGAHRKMPLPRLLLKSPLRGMALFPETCQGRRWVGRRHHECVISLSVQVKRPPSTP